MSERWQICPRCQGQGKLFKRDSVLCITREIECSRCNGEGFIGDSMENRKEDAHREVGDEGYGNQGYVHPLQKAIEAFEKAKNKE